MSRKYLSLFGLACLLAAACSHEQKPDGSTAAPARLAASSTPKPAAAAPAPVAAEPEATPTPAARNDDAIFFEYDSALVKDDARPVLQELARRLRANPQAKIRIEGNCDERGTTEYNLALGQERAEAARRYLQSLGIPADRIVTTSFGSERPASTEHDEQAWAKNRRDDLKVQ